jgi:hypothetical protein
LIQGGRGDGGRVNGSDPSRKISVETTMTSAGPTSTASNIKNEGLHLIIFLIQAALVICRLFICEFAYSHLKNDLKWHFSSQKWTFYLPIQPRITRETCTSNLLLIFNSFLKRKVIFQFLRRPKIVFLWLFWEK